MSLRKQLLIGAILIGAFQGHQIVKNRGEGIESLGAKIGKDLSEGELRQLAATMKQGDVVIYTTTGCPYCAQAKSWMTQYGFEFTECDAEASATCAQELDALDADGMPYLLVRGHHMKDGFDSDEFVAALRI